MKTTPTLKTLTLAAAAGLIAGLASPPVAKAVDTYFYNGDEITTNHLTPYGYVDFGEGGFYLPINIHGNGYIGCANAVIGSGSMPTTLNVYGGGSLNASHLSFGDAPDSSLNVLSDGYVLGMNIDMGMASADRFINVEGANALLECVSTFTIGWHGSNARTLSVKNGGTVTASTLELNGVVELEDGTMNVDYLYMRNSAQVTLGSGSSLFVGGLLHFEDGTQLTFGLSSSAGSGMIVDSSGSVSIDASSGIQINVSTEEIFAQGTVFTIFDGVTYDNGMWGYSVTAPTGQVFDVVYDHYQYGITLVATAPIPEPSTYALIGGVGAVALALLRRRKRKA